MQPDLGNMPGPHFAFYKWPNGTPIFLGYLSVKSEFLRAIFKHCGCSKGGGGGVPEMPDD